MCLYIPVVTSSWLSERRSLIKWEKFVEAWIMASVLENCPIIHNNKPVSDMIVYIHESLFNPNDGNRNRKIKCSTIADE